MAITPMWKRAMTWNLVASCYHQQGVRKPVWAWSLGQSRFLVLENSSNQNRQVRIKTRDGNNVLGIQISKMKGLY